MCVLIPIKTITRPSKQCKFCFYLDKSFDLDGPGGPGGPGGPRGPGGPGGPSGQPI